MKWMVCMPQDDDCTVPWDVLGLGHGHQMLIQRALTGIDVGPGRNVNLAEPRGGTLRGEATIRAHPAMQSL